MRKKVQISSAEDDILHAVISFSSRFSGIEDDALHAVISFASRFAGDGGEEKGGRSLQVVQRTKLERGGGGGRGGIER